ncbi:MAG: hypothetical protein Q9202_007511 [Teloschistes flavicans]
MAPTSNSPSPRSSATHLPTNLAPPPPPPPSTLLSSASQHITTAGVENAAPNPTSSRPRLAFAGAGGHDGRRPSVQFAPARTEEKVRKDKEVELTSSAFVSGNHINPIFFALQPHSIRNNANKPPRKYERRVSFNTFDNRDAPDLSFNIGIRHRDYAYTQRSRTFLCGTDDNEYSYDAIEWLIEELVEDGDEIICLRVVDPSSKFASDAGVKNETYKKEAHDLLEKIRNKNKTKEEVREKAIVLVIEFAVGKVPEVFQKMISVYAPACLIVGTKGKSPQGVQTFLTGSVSRYCLQNSPVPCIVVRPTRKRIARKEKRLNDEKRERVYQNVLEMSGKLGGRQILPAGGGRGDGGLKRLTGEGGSDVGSEEAEQKEAEAVARAIGLPSNARSLRDHLPGLRRPPTSAPRPDDEAGPLARAHSANRSEGGTSVGETPSPTGRLMMSEGEESSEDEPEDGSSDADADADADDDDDDDDDNEDEDKDEGDGGGEASAAGEKSEVATKDERGRTMSQDQGEQRTGAKKFVFPKERRKSEGG